MNENYLQGQLRKWFATADYKLFNTFIFAWESDFFCITKSGYAIEVEIKISRSDFKADFKKEEKHYMLSHADRTHFTIPGHPNLYPRKD